MPDNPDIITIVPVNEGVTTCILGFLLVCLIFPTIVKNRPQYYAALAFVIAIVLLHSLGLMIKTAGFQVFAGAMTGLLQAGAILLLVLCVGGLRLRELAGELKGAYEVMRRGETEKEVIIPLQHRPAGSGAAGAAGGGSSRPEASDSPTVYSIDPRTGEDIPNPTDWRDMRATPAPAAPPPSGSIPLSESNPSEPPRSVVS
jgi:hypothetical protein